MDTVIDLKFSPQQKEISWQNKGPMKFDSLKNFL